MAGGMQSLHRLSERVSGTHPSWPSHYNAPLPLGDLFLPFLVDLPLSHRISAALLIACLAVARSKLAVVRERLRLFWRLAVPYFVSSQELEPLAFRSCSERPTIESLRE